jgi:hypothetical protein
MTRETSAPAIDPSAVDREALNRLVGGAHHNPHEILGAHPTGDGRTVVRPPYCIASTTAGCSPGQSTVHPLTTGCR